MSCEECIRKDLEIAALDMEVTRLDKENARLRALVAVGKEMVLYAENNDMAGMFWLEPLIRTWRSLEGK